MGASWADQKIKKKSSLWSVFSFYETANHFSIRLWHALINGLYTTTNNDQFSGWTEKKLHRSFQNQTCTKEMVMVIVWGSAAHLIHYSFMNPGELLHLRSMLSKSRCTVNCNICSQHWSTERARLFSTTTLDCMSHNQRFKSWMNWVTRFCLICGIHRNSLANWLPLLQASQLFARKMLPQPAGGRKCFPRVHQILKDGFLCYRNKQTFLIGKMCWS